GALVWQPYSADFPGTEYAKPIRRYIHAAVRQDSTALVRVSASSEAVSWGLMAGRDANGRLAQWERWTQAWTGKQRGDTAQVFVYTEGTVCQNFPIQLQLVGSDGEARVVRASSSCWSP
ncbi:MAG TPA: hypothetical protein VJU17_08430, partial [Gemmatimonadales bacterium]|nr:hypothetical protein [Gemmatimonadales bacterium]